MKNLVGSTLLKQFRVETFLAAGGMGSVFKVWDLKRSVYLAMKVLQEDLADDPVVLRRFQREARTLAQLTHPNIVPFYGLYQDSGYTFLLEAFIDGHTLKDILRAQGGQPLEPAEALGYLQPLTSALGYAHKHRLVHCDLKPGNVMVDHSGVYLTDFGVVRHAEATVTSLGFAGTPAYMAPEQCRGEPVTAATDIYALGIIAYEMLTGRRPFLGNETRRGDTATLKERLRAAQIHAQPPDPRRFNSSLNDDAARALLQALQKDPVRRFHNAQGFYQALQASLDAAPLPPRVVPAGSGAGVVPPAPPDQARGVRLSGKLTPGAWTAIGAGAAAVLLGAFALFGRGGDPPPAAAPPSSAREASPTSAVSVAEIAAPTKTSAPVEPDPTATPRPTATVTPTPEPSYSAEPTGRIVFTCYVNEMIDQICTVNVDGSDYRQLTFSDDTNLYASFAPDGESIIFSSARSGNDEIYEMDADGSNVVRLTYNIGDGLYAPHISPDGRRIVFTNVRDNSSSIWVMNRDGSNPRPITDLVGEDLDPVWSPDGSQIAFATYRAGDRQLFIMNADGSGMRQVTNLPDMGGRNSWSPDGEWLAFYAGERPDHREAYIIRTDGSDLFQLTHGGDNLAPCFSNDGQWLVYTSYLNGDMELYIIRPDGTDRRQITHNTYSDWQPRWEP